MAITLKDIQKLDNGARFYTADLHIHTFGGSADVKDAGMTVESVIDTSIAQGISLIAITDHNSDKNLQAASDYAQKYTGQLLLIPGVEISTSNGHLLAYFPPDKLSNVRDLLARVSIVGEYGGRDSHTTQSMASVIGEVERLGGISIAAHIDRQKNGFESAIAGYPNSKRDILISSGLYGFEFDDAAHLIWYSPEDEPTPEGAERKKLLNARTQSTATAARLRLAAIQDSDAHSVSQLTAKRVLTRFKMNELSFDGLRTALIDPEARVRAVATIPPTFPRVLGMYTAGGFLDGQTFCFSDNLNCFIGGRGTGKSTAIQSLAYGLGVRDTLEEFDNCPDDVVIYCEDTNGILYRYERPRNLSPTVRAKEDQSIKDVPADAFRVEFFGQGDLAEVAKNPLKNPVLLQEFLDRHIAIKDLDDKQKEILDELSQNSAQLIPLAAAAAQLPGKKTALGNLDVKLKIAETGKVKEIAAFQITLAAEKAVSTALTKISKEYTAGLSLTNFIRDYQTIVANAGTVTDDKECQEQLRQAKAILDAANEFLRAEQTAINGRLKAFGAQLDMPLQSLNKRHAEFEQQINDRMSDLRKKGLSGSLDELNRLIKQRTALAAEISKLESDAPQLADLESKRRELLKDLIDVRDKIMQRRKGQLAGINKNLGSTIKDYAVNIYYDQSGIWEDFKAQMLTVMHGTYLQEDIVDNLCSAITPLELAELISKGRPEEIAAMTGVADNWSKLIVQRFQVLIHLHELQTIWKPPRPVIKVLTKGAQVKQIPVNQLSDGQKHTILLTIAMLAESNLPLIIDQPEDDLDNAFVFSTVVSNLRSIKERRQVILVTHNANIAVLGDSELLFPMRRSGDNGTVFNRGSVDRQETKREVQDILEGGELAFQRRKEIYGH